MKQILMIEVSPRGKDSASRSVADALAARLAASIRRRSSSAATSPPSICPIWTRSRSAPSRPGTRPRPKA